MGSARLGCRAPARMCSADELGVLLSPPSVRVVVLTSRDAFPLWFILFLGRGSRPPLDLSHHDGAHSVVREQCGILPIAECVYSSGHILYPGTDHRPDPPSDGHDPGGRTHRPMDVTQEAGGRFTVNRLPRLLRPVLSGRRPTRSPHLRAGGLKLSLLCVEHLHNLFGVLSMGDLPLLPIYFFT